MNNSKVTVYFDGACEPINPKGTASWGYRILWPDGEITERYAVLGKGEGMSNNVAEYAAAGFALASLVGFGWAGPIEMRGDSQLVVQQMRGAWQIKSGLYTRYAHRVRELAGQLGKVSWQWIPRDDNHAADALSKRALSEADVRIRERN